LNRFQFFSQTKKKDYATWRRAIAKNSSELIDHSLRSALEAAGLALPDKNALYVGDDNVLASGPAVGKGITFGTWLRDHVDRKACAMEMESAGVYDASLIRTPSPETIAIRGISDFADLRKAKLQKIAGKRVRVIAIKNAVSLFVAGIRAGFFPARVNKKKLPRSRDADAHRGVKSPPRSIPPDVETRAQTMILGGRAPPSAWVRYIRKLDFSATKLRRLELLSGLTALQELNLTDTNVSDLSPISSLISLRDVDLSATEVSDLSPLSGLTGLEVLWLLGDEVSDLSPLTGLKALKRLSLAGTAATDLVPLSGLTGLNTLDLMNAEVSDLSPLSGLMALEWLDLSNTKVTDLSPLSGLIGLQYLALDLTEVKDLSPLSALPALRELILDKAQVIETSPLDHIPNLKIRSLG
jgi:Leucine-rich repeat (LRR) protein